MKSHKIVILFLIFIYSCCVAYELKQSEIADSREPNEIQSFLRLKRQLEDLDSDLNTEETQDTKDPSFWDRMIKIALNLFSKLVQWLNT
ncbi:uncharacterized protein LOC126969897 [Leptidea sinapis]|uniref:uncharacterized protein LOC126969897 n=1 Tax=Leptidea sinapis TaxID=189913 RepID=UPI00213C5429|nr:uncharacterized protein LOC126969897 [Leptidea sinapis]